jgi:hypothetical protein
LRRLEKLEARRPPLEIDGLFWSTQGVDREAILANERVVEDWHLDSEDGILSITERITTDPTDQGWNYRETAEGQIIDSSLQREITVVNNSHFYRVVSISEADISIDPEAPE